MPTTTAALEALHTEGFVLLPGVANGSQVAALRQAIDALEPVHWDYRGLVDDHYKCVFNRSPFWLPYLELPGVIELAEAALGADCHVIGQTAWRSHPGFVGGDVHQDYLAVALPEALAADPALRLPMQVLTAHLFLDRITPELCPTCVIPGSHRAGRPPRPGERSWRGRAAEPVLCEAGDVLVFRSDLWHSGSRNQTADRTRYLLQVHYGRRMVAQKFSPYLDWQWNPAVIAAATPRQRRLLGDHEAAEYDCAARRAAETPRARRSRPLRRRWAIRGSDMTRLCAPTLAILLALIAGCMESNAPDRSSEGGDEGASVQMERHDVEQTQ